MKFTKYHALGNDYIVVDPKDLDHEITETEIKILCNRHYGFGSDGVLYGPLKSERGDFKVRIFNPDSSEAEKSGNGLRIFSRYLWDMDLVNDATFSIDTKGGLVRARVSDSGAYVSVEMGRVNFTHESGICLKPKSELISVKNRKFEFYRANVGNPHCVIPVLQIEPSMAITYGKAIEEDARFVNRTNVQFMEVVDRNKIKIDIWERGAGYTMASGSSSTVCAAVAYGLGLCGPEVSVIMPGGEIQIVLDGSYNATMKGAVCKIGDGNISAEAFGSA